MLAFWESHTARQLLGQRRPASKEVTTAGPPTQRCRPQAGYSRSSQAKPVQPAICNVCGMRVWALTTTAVPCYWTNQICVFCTGGQQDKDCAFGGDIERRTLYNFDLAGCFTWAPFHLRKYMPSALCRALKLQATMSVSLNRHG